MNSPSPSLHVLGVPHGIENTFPILQRITLKLKMKDYNFKKHLTKDRCVHKQIGLSVGM
jgi:hypothetical protein